MADDPPASIVEQLRDAIRASGLSLNQLSIKAGIDRSQLSRFMLGNRDRRRPRRAAAGRSHPHLSPQVQH